MDYNTYKQRKYDVFVESYATLTVAAKKIKENPEDKHIHVEWLLEEAESLEARINKIEEEAGNGKD